MGMATNEQIRRAAIMLSWCKNPPRHALGIYTAALVKAAPKLKDREHGNERK